MSTDHQRIREFVSRKPYARRLFTLLETAGFRVVSVLEKSPRIWAFLLELSDDLRMLLGTSRQVLVWVADFDRFNTRTVTEAQEEIERHAPRLCEDFAIIFTRDPRTKAAVDETTQRLQTQFIGFSFADADAFQPVGSKDFLQSLQERFFTKDLYYVSTAIRSPNAFFGRKSLIAEIGDHLKTGDAHVGLFGLRKMGKTSLLYRVMESIRTGGGFYTAHVELQRVVSVRCAADYLLWSVGTQLLDENKPLRKLKGVKLLGKYPSLSEVPSRVDLVEGLYNDLRTLLRKTNQRFVLFFDEIERLVGGSTTSQPSDAFVRSWRLLRGLDQEFPGRLGFFVAGTNPKCVEVNRIGTEENPIYNYFAKYYLPPLLDDDVSLLLKRLGERMGLRWSEEAVHEIQRLAGGHPFLLRAHASHVHRALLPRTVKIDVTEDNVQEQVEGVLTELSSVFSQMIEVLKDEYQDEYVLLDTLARAKLGDFRELALAYPECTAHLVGYGVIEKDIHDPKFTVELLASWMARRLNEQSRRVQGSRGSEWLPDTAFEGYKIESQVGHAGGFAKVYRAIGLSSYPGQIVALKILHGGSYAALQREVDALEGISHKNIVKILDYGQAASGELYLVMEYLDGRTLDYYCSPATKLKRKDARQLVIDLLQALVSLHPDDAVVEELRQKPELQPEDLERLNRARHGYIHRDIKPQNIMRIEGRGAVLIDFNISVRVAEPVTTTSSTKGYLPPDGVSGEWTPDVDLFQAGVTALQLVLGLPFDGENLQDLREACRKESEGPLREVLLRLTSSERSDRFKTAREALAAIGIASPRE